MAATIDNPPALDAGHALEQLILRLRREFQIALDDAGIPLSPPEIMMLRLLERAPGCSLQRLAHFTGRDKAQVTRQVRALEARRLVRRERDATDQRSFRLFLTAEGRRVEKRVRGLRAAIHRKLFSGLDRAEREQLRDLLNRCAVSLR